MKTKDLERRGTSLCRHQYFLVHHTLHRHGHFFSDLHGHWYLQLHSDIHLHTAHHCERMHVLNMFEVSLPAKRSETAFEIRHRYLLDNDALVGHLDGHRNILVHNPLDLLTHSHTMFNTKAIVVTTANSHP